MKHSIVNYLSEVWNKNGWFIIFVGCFITLFIVWLISDNKGSSDFESYGDMYENFSNMSLSNSNPSSSTLDHNRDDEFSNKKKEQQENYYKFKIRNSKIEENISDISSLKSEPIFTSKSESKSDEFIYEDTASKGENLCRKVIEELTGKPFMKVRPPWLKNPITKTFLELDIYNSELDLAIEYNGIQHKKYVKHFHKSKEAFYNMQYRDYIKKELCRKHGTYLIIVENDIKLKDIANFIRDEYQKFKRNR